MVDGKTFREQFLQEWSWPSAEEVRMLAIAEEYHRACDAFDDAHCSGQVDGESVPATANERRAMNHNASRVRRSLIEKHNLAPAEFRETLKLHAQRHRK